MSNTRPDGWGTRPEPSTTEQRREYEAMQESEGIDPNAAPDPDKPASKLLPGARAWGFS